MTQRSRAFDDLANLLANAAGAAKGVGDEMKAMGRAKAEKMVADLDLVTREEFDVLKARLDKQAAEIADLKAVLEARTKPAAKKAATKKTTTKKKPASK